MNAICEKKDGHETWYKIEMIKYVQGFNLYSSF